MGTPASRPRAPFRRVRPLCPSLAGSLGVGLAPRSALRLACAGLSLLVAAGPARAGSPDSLEDEVRNLRGKVAELETSRDDALRQLEDLRDVVSELQAALRSVQQAPRGVARDGTRGSLAVPAIATGSDLAGGVQVAQEQGGGGTPGAVPEDETVGTEKAEERDYSAERVILERQGGVLLPPGQLVLEPGFQYTNNQINLLNVSGFFPIPGIVIGRIETDAINRDFYTTTLDARYGLHRRAELSVSVPYGWRFDRVESDLGGANEDVTRTTDNAIGDVQFGVSTQLLYARNWWPDVTLNVLAKAPTGPDPFEIQPDELAFGTGTWSINSGVTLVRSLDPAVIYGSFRYLWDLERTFRGVDVDIGDTYEYTAGLAYSLNERLAFTTLLQHSITGRTQLNGVKLAGSDLNVARLFFGTSYRVSEVVTANLQVGVGLTEDAPDFSIELSFPLRMPWELPHLERPRF